MFYNNNLYDCREGYEDEKQTSARLHTVAAACPHNTVDFSNDVDENPSFCFVGWVLKEGPLILIP